MGSLGCQRQKISKGFFLCTKNVCGDNFQMSFKESYFFVGKHPFLWTISGGMLCC